MATSAAAGAIDQLAEIFGPSVPREVLAQVLQHCKGDVAESAILIEALMNQSTNVPPLFRAHTCVLISSSSYRQW